MPPGTGRERAGAYGNVPDLPDTTGRAGLASDDVDHDSGYAPESDYSSTPGREV